MENKNVYAKLKKSELIERLEIIESVLSEKDASLGAIQGELLEVKGALKNELISKETKETERHELQEELHGLQSELNSSKKIYERLSDIESAEWQSLRAWKFVAALEALISVILVLTLIF